MARKVEKRQVADKETRRKRVSICKACEYNKDMQICKQCNCDLKAKVARFKSKCPINKW